RYALDKIVSVWTSRDLASEKEGELADRALADAGRAAGRGLSSILADSASAWEQRWRDAVITISADQSAQRALRFAMYHLIIAGNARDPRVSISARTLSGEGYNGHVFWDSETFMLPFFTFTDPNTARALLLYRCATLSGARAKARIMGFQGAMYAWESADTGI